MNTDMQRYLPLAVKNRCGKRLLMRFGNEPANKKSKFWEIRKLDFFYISIFSHNNVKNMT